VTISFTLFGCSPLRPTVENGSSVAHVSAVISRLCLSISIGQHKGAAHDISHRLAPSRCGEKPRDSASLTFSTRWQLPSCPFFLGRTWTWTLAATLGSSSLGPALPNGQLFTY
jgi:hypothetical protein